RRGVGGRGDGDRLVVVRETDIYLVHGISRHAQPPLLWSGHYNLTARWVMTGVWRWYPLSQFLARRNSIGRWLNKARVNRRFREGLADYPASNERSIREQRTKG